MAPRAPGCATSASRGRALVAAAGLLLASLPAGDASAQCSTDVSGRWTWTYPAEGATVSRYAPLLWRFVGVPAGSPTYSAGMLVDQPLVPLTPLTPFVELAISGVAGMSVLPADASMHVELPVTQAAAPLQLAFTTLADEVAPPSETLELLVHGHFVGTDVELPSERCREILFVPGAEPCWGEPGVVSVGFDVELQAVGASGTREPARAEVRAFAVVPEDQTLTAGWSRPRPWPPECGPPRLFTTLDLDQPERCFTLAAFVDAALNERKVVRSSPYCLGDGAEWPPPEPASVDAGVALPGSAGSSPLPPMTTQPVFCGCFCPAGVQGQIACDYASGSGAWGQAGTPAVTIQPGGGAAGTGPQGDGEIAGAGGAGDGTGTESGGCGCRLARTSSPRLPALALSLGLALCAQRRRRANPSR